ncbi:MAG: hypothetical protein V3V81_08200 [Candidatus Bathyarchaeia archaeon]
MAKNKEIKEPTAKEKATASKENLAGFSGGMDLNLDQLHSDGQSLRTKLSAHLKTTLDVEIRNQEKLVEKLNKWQRQYKGVKEPKNWPWVGAANVSAPVSRTRTDVTLVRLIEAIWSKALLILVRAMKKELIGADKKLEEGLNHFLKHTLKFKEKLLSPLMQCVKSGTGMAMLDYAERRRTVYRYATEKEKKDKSVHKYALKGTSDKAVKYVDTLYRGPDIYPIDRADVIVSSDATNIQDAYLVGFKKDYRWPQIELKVRQGLFYSEQANELRPAQPEELKVERAKLQGKASEKTRYEEPYQVYALWLNYDVDEDGEEDSIMVNFHHETGAILRAIYNPIFKQFKPFIDYVFYPTEYSLDGEGVCEILENLQEQIDTIINQRLDRGTQMNCPILFVREGSGIAEKLRQLKPGEVIEVDDDLESAIREFRFSDVYPSTFAEEDRLMRYADQAVGVTADIMGQPTADRPVFRETAAHLQEAYKKFNYGVDNIRRKIVDTVYMILEFFAQYQPEYTYTVQEGEKVVEKTINFPIELIRDGLNIELAASGEIFSQDIRQQINLTVYQMLSDDMTKAAGMAQMLENPNVPDGFKKLIIDANRIRVKILTRVLDDFNIKDADDLVLDIEKSITEEDIQAAQIKLQQLQAQMQAQQAQPQPQAPPQGQAPVG